MFDISFKGTCHDFNSRSPIGLALGTIESNPSCLHSGLMETRTHGFCHAHPDIETDGIDIRLGFKILLSVFDFFINEILRIID